MSERSLNELRLRIRVIDSELVRLLGKRFRLARKIGMLKQELKKPVVDRATERAVIENFVASGIEAGIDQAFARRVANLIIEGSVEVQRSLRSKGIGRYPPANVAVIGAGGMGIWFARFFNSRGDIVTVSDRDGRKARLLASTINAKQAPSNVEAVRGCDVVILAVPASVASKVVKEILPVLGKNVLLLDISAVKSGVMPALRLAGERGVEVASIHPMFGPLASSARGKNVILVQTGTRKPSGMAREILEGAHVRITSPQVHDRQTALTLALPHFLNLALAMTMAGRNFTELRAFAARTFSMQMLIAEIVADEPETTTDILIMNKEFRVVLRDFQRNVLALAKIVNRNDRGRMIAYSRRIREQLSSDPKFELAGEAFEKACVATLELAE